jgi:hypothetical protein
VLKEGYLKWWSIYEAESPRLAQLARDIFGIPGMSAEVERLFSSAKLIIPPYRSSLRPKQLRLANILEVGLKEASFMAITLSIYQLIGGQKRRQEGRRDCNLLLLSARFFLDI